jgi:hypothetical protein
MNIELVSLVLVHFLCNAQAEITLMSTGDAMYCSENFEDVKASLHPRLTPEAFRKLGDRQRGRTSVEGYGYYKDWVAANPELVARLKDAAALLASQQTASKTN